MTRISRIKHTAKGGETCAFAFMIDKRMKSEREVLQSSLGLVDWLSKGNLQVNSGEDFSVLFLLCFVLQHFHPLSACSLSL